MAYDPTIAANHDVSLKQIHSLATTIKQKIADAIAALPAEMFLNHTKSSFVPNFTWSAATYPGSTDPSLNGKPVMVFAIDSVDNVTKAVTTAYSFMDMSSLVDTYTTKTGATSQAMTIAGYEIELHFDPATDNHLSVTANGLMVDVSDKADKVANATAGNIVTLDANGNIVDSGRTFATDAEFAEMIANVFPTA